LEINGLQADRKRVEEKICELVIKKEFEFDSEGKTTKQKEDIIGIE